MSHWLTAFGLRILSDIDLLCPPSEQGPVDLRLLLHRTHVDARAQAGIQWGRSEDGREAWAAVPGIARVRAKSNSEVVIEASQTVPVETLRMVAISIALPLILHQREGLVLEASAVTWNGKGLLLVGRGFCGKSSLAALISDVGGQLLSDSHSHILFDEDDRLAMYPAFPHVRLWPTQRALLNGNWPEPEVLRPEISKQLFAVPARFARTRTRIHGFVVLARGVDDEFHVRRLKLPEVLRELANASDRLGSPHSRAAAPNRFGLLTGLGKLPVAHLLQWPRRSDSFVECRNRLLKLTSLTDGPCST